MSRITQLADEKELRTALGRQYGDGNLRYPLLLMTPHGDVKILTGTIEGSREGIAWAAQHYGKAAA